MESTMTKHLVPLVSAAALGLTTFAFAASAGAAEGGRPIAVELTGEAERPTAGDPDGTGTATFRINPGQERICYTLTVAGIDPARAAHIHVASTDVAGPVVVPLDAPTDGTSSGCADVPRDLALDILTNPEDYYVNVHNVMYPGGALRGQLG
jgi:CHRD domain